MEKLHNIVYQTTNLITNEAYRGAHCTDNLNDGYLGSGRVLKNAIKKYGKENFKREDVYDFATAELAFWYEQYFVDQDWVDRSDTYNLTIGGRGKLNVNNHLSLSTRQKLREANLGKKASKETSEKISKRVTGKGNPMYGKKHSERALQKQRDAHIGRIYKKRGPYKRLNNNGKD